MAPLGTLSALLATFLFPSITPNTIAIAATAESTTTTSSPIIPTLHQFETTYSSSQSAAGFMFDVKAKKSISIFGLNANLVPSSVIQNGPQVNVTVYTKEGSYKNHESDESSWDLWMTTTITSYGMDGPTSIPQREEDAAIPLFVGAREKRSFYLTFDGPYLRYSHQEDVGDKMYYINHDMVIYANGAAKRRGWDGTALSPRVYNGGMHYYLVPDETNNIAPSLSLPEGVSLLPDGIVSNPPTTHPTNVPTNSPTVSIVPTISLEPTEHPTKAPTKMPTRKPTPTPTSSPVAFDVLSTTLEDASTKPVLVYAGQMFDVKGRDDVEIHAIGIHTYLATEMEVRLYVREGGYEGAEDDIEGWTHRANVTVVGRGMGNPTYLPARSFEPILVREKAIVGIYIATDGPYLRASRGGVDVDGEGKGKGKSLPAASNSELVLFEGVGKRHPMTSGTIRPRIFNGVIGYRVVDIPTPSPTINTADLFVRNITLVPARDTYIQKGIEEDVAFGRKAQLKVDGSPECVALLEFDMSALSRKDDPDEAPNQILSAVLRLYSMTESDFGGYVSIIPEGWIDNENSMTWENSPYATREVGRPLGEFRSIWPNKYYEMDITHAFRDNDGDDNDGNNNIPEYFVIRISSDRENGVMYRSRVGASGNGPELLVKFAYDPDDKKALAREFGSDPPTLSPTMKPTTPEWENPKTMSNPPRTYFNYNPRSRYGVNEWHKITPDGYYDRLKKLKTDVWRNKCKSGTRQSPRDLCRTNDECLEYHETRNRRGEYGLDGRDESKARPTPHIMHNKLRLSYKERRSEHEEPIPPGADFARNGQNSGVQDLVHIDWKVRSEHKLCGRQYDAEMQLYYLHQYGNLEAVSVLINADGEAPNDHFQKMLDFFQKKFDADRGQCRRRQRRARALLLDKSSKRLRGGSASVSSEADAEFETYNAAESPPSEADDGFEDFDEPDSPASIGNNNPYQNIQNGFLRLAHRREAKDLRWDPMEPWEVQKTVHFWAYTGSTTEPPCFEDVKWRILDVPMTISHPQLVQLKKLMFDHVDPDTCRKTSTHYEESNARPVQPYRGGAIYRCKRSDYASDMERTASGRRRGFVLREKWRGVDMLDYVEPEFPDV